MPFPSVTPLGSLRAYRPFMLLIAVLAGASASAKEDSGDTIVAKVNGFALNLQAYNYFMKAVRSDVIGEMSRKYPGLSDDGTLWERDLDGVKVGERVKQKALERAARYYAIVAKGTELALTRPEDEPFHGQNMSEQRQNKTIYGPTILSDDMVVSAYESNLLEKIKATLVPESLFSEEDARRYYEQHPEVQSDRAGVLFRKIFMSYTPETKAGKRALMEELRRRADDGESFDGLAERHSETFRENGWVGYDERGRQMIFRRGVEDRFLMKEFLDMAEGEIRGVVDSGKGFYLVRCEKVAERERGFEEMRNRIMALMIERKFAEASETFIAAPRIDVVPENYRAIVVQ